MRRLLVSVVGSGLMLVATAGPGFCEVNCKLVAKDMSMGRTPEDIAERMGASVDEVRKCQADAGAAASGADAATTGAAKDAAGAAASGAAAGAAGAMDKALGH
jgi:hypothetical protein